MAAVAGHAAEFSTLLSDLVTRYGLELLKHEFDRLLSVLFVNRDFIDTIPDFEHETAYKMSVWLMEEEKNKKAIADAVAAQLAGRKSGRGGKGDSGGREGSGPEKSRRRRRDLCFFFNKQDGVCKLPNGICNKEHAC